MWPRTADTITTARGAPRTRSSARRAASASATAANPANAAPILKDRPDANGCEPANCHAASSEWPSAKPLRRPATPLRTERAEGRSRYGECLQHDPGSDQHDSAAQKPERCNEAKEEHETIERQGGCEAGLEKQPCGFVPGRVERDPSRAAGQREAARRACILQELQLQLEPVAQLGRHVDPEGNASTLGGQGILELGVEEALVPEEIGFGWQGRPFHVRARSGIAREGAVRQKRNSRLAHRRREHHAVCAQLDLPCACCGDLLEPLCDAGKIEVARPALGQAEAREQVEWNTHEQQQPALLLPDVALQHDFRGQIGAVCKCRRRHSERRREG